MTPRQKGTNPRAMGTNPRAKGTNLRALGLNPRKVVKDRFLTVLTLVLEKRRIIE